MMAASCCSSPVGGSNNDEITNLPPPPSSPSSYNNQEINNNNPEKGGSCNVKQEEEKEEIRESVSIPIIHSGESKVEGGVGGSLTPWATWPILVPDQHHTSNPVSIPEIHIGNHDIPRGADHPGHPIGGGVAAGAPIFEFPDPPKSLLQTTPGHHHNHHPGSGGDMWQDLGFGSYINTPTTALHGAPLLWSQGAAMNHYIPSGLSRESSRDDLTSVGEHIFEYEERFRVDRRKLELMIRERLDQVREPACDFFNRIGEETGVTVIWPSRLKIGAKSKKDPHIRVGGNEEGVKRAKARIMEFLDNKTNRITMKMDVSYTDHSHVIGKGGNTIRRVMAETNCHIHFPDSNRSNPNEKSNQVSIAGEIDGVEKARARVRELTPLVFNFDIPIITSYQNTPDPSDPYLRAIQDQYNIQVMFRQKQKNFHTTTVVVKGCEWEGSRVKEATLLLIEHLCQPSSTPIPVAMNMEISPQHHSIVLGKGNITLKLIMQRTNTTILFPDAGDPNIPSIRKGSVTITGAIHNVYLARQQLVGSLPLVMMFDLPDNIVIDDNLIRSLQEENDVSINVKPKARQSNKSVIIKAQERNASGIYRARKELLGLDEPDSLIAVIPETYKIQGVPPVNSLDPGFSLPVNHRSNSAAAAIAASAVQAALPPPPAHHKYNYSHPPPNLSYPPTGTIPMPTQHATNTMLSSSPLSPNPMSGFHQPLTPTTPWNTPAVAANPAPPIPPPVVMPNSMGLSGMTPNHPYLQEYAMLVLSNISRLHQQQQQQQQEQQQHQQQEQQQPPTTQPQPQQQPPDVWIQKDHDKNDECDPNNNYLHAGSEQSCLGSLNESPPPNGTSPRNSSPTHTNGNLTNNLSKLDLNQTVLGNSGGSDTHSSGLGTDKHSSSSGSDFTPILGELSDRRAPGFEIKNRQFPNVNVDCDYDLQKVRAAKAMTARLTSNEPRTPTPAWAGLGFSRSMNQMTSLHQDVVDISEDGDNPASSSANSGNLASNNEKYQIPDKTWSNRPFGTSTFETHSKQISANDDLPSILFREGLSNYTDVFLRHEIDLQTFSALTEGDLKEIGIQTFGARKRILAITIEVKHFINNHNHLKWKQ